MLIEENIFHLQDIVFIFSSLNKHFINIDTGDKNTDNIIFTLASQSKNCYSVTYNILAFSSQSSNYLRRNNYYSVIKRNQDSRILNNL